jgi:hypothetical protein
VARSTQGGRPPNIDRVLLAVQNPTQFKLVVNLKAAKTIGLTIPETLLLRADGLID